MSISTEKLPTSWRNWPLPAKQRLRDELAKELQKFGTAANPAPTPYLSFREFVAKVRPRFQWYRHCVILAGVLQKVADGELRRVMVFMPPRHGKSEEVSRLFSAYYLYRYPERFVGINSYAQDLANTLSRAARENYKAAGGKTKDDADTIKQWETPQGGGLWAAGVGGPITGKGFHLGIIDDPLKNAEEAQSETIRNNHHEWYRSTFYTREEPGESAIVVVQTRWHEADLSGWLLSEEEADEEPEGWHVVCFPAIAEPVEDRQEFPPTCTVEADTREAGEALCPERYPIDRLRTIMRRVGEYFWSALFGQRPTAKDGQFFKPGEIIVEKVAPAFARSVRAWDLAATEGGGDYTNSVKMAGPDRNGLLWILDVVRGQWGPERVDSELKTAAIMDGRGTHIRLAQDPGAAGKRDARNIVKMLAGYHVSAESVSGSKETRARSFASQVNAGNVRMVKAPWNAAYIEELRAFPRGAHDDQVDASGDACEVLIGGKSKSVISG